MTPAQFLPIIGHAAQLLPMHDGNESRCLLLAIAGQESGWVSRLQVPVSYARGFWQAEKNGAVLSVLTHADTRDAFNAVLEGLCIPQSLDDVFQAVAWHDDLAYCVARLALAIDPAPLPAIGDVDGGWTTYVRVWRPGRPRPETWRERYDAAAALFVGGV